MSQRPTSSDKAHLDAIQNERLTNAVLDPRIHVTLSGGTREGTSCMTGDKQKMSDMDFLVTFYVMDKYEQSKFMKPIPACPGFYTLHLSSEQENHFLRQLGTIQGSNGDILLSVSSVKHYVDSIIKENVSPNVFRYNEISEYINTPSISGAEEYDVIKLSEDLVYTILSPNSWPDAAEKWITRKTIWPSDAEDYDVINLSKDLVPAIFCPNSWPHAAEKWITRKRIWPKPETIREICDSGFHLVCKASAAGDINKEWRLSFSIVENYLIDSLTDVQHTVYKSFKDVVKNNSTFISSYLLKTVFFWECESRTNSWTFENMHFYLEGLLLNLYHGLGSGEINHYFLEYNLLQDIPSEKLKAAALEVETIMDQTEMFAWDWKFKEECDLFNLVFNVALFKVNNTDP